MIVKEVYDLRYEGPTPKIAHNLTSNEAEIRDAMVAKLLISQSDIPPAKRNLSAHSHLTGFNTRVARF